MSEKEIEKTKNLKKNILEQEKRIFGGDRQQRE